jgi:hypothetical protein
LEVTTHEYQWAYLVSSNRHLYIGDEYYLTYGVNVRRLAGLGFRCEDDPLLPLISQGNLQDCNRNGPLLHVIRGRQVIDTA